MGVINILANLTDVVIWICAPIIGTAFGLIARGGSWKKRQQLSSTVSTSQIQRTPVRSGLSVTTRDQGAPVGSFISQARAELIVLGTSLVFLTAEKPRIKALIERGVTATFLLLDPKYCVNVVVPMGWSGLEEGVKLSIKNLCELYRELKREYQERLKIYLYNRYPVNNMIFVDPQAVDPEASKISFGAYLFGSEVSQRPVIFGTRAQAPEFYDKCFADCSKVLHEPSTHPYKC